MVAAEFGAPEGGLVAKAGTAAAVTKAAGRRNMLLLSAGTGLMRFALKIPNMCAKALLEG